MAFELDGKCLEEVLIGLHGLAAGLAMLFNHCRVVEVSGQFRGSNWGCVVHVVMRDHILLVSRHPASMWWAVSISHRQSRQVGLWSHLRFARRSYNQTLICTVKAKNLHFGGAQASQMEAMVGFLVTPMNCALYVDAIEYRAFCVNFHEIWSACIDWRSTWLTRLQISVKYLWSRMRLNPNQ